MGLQTFSPSPEFLQEVASRHGLGTVHRSRRLTGGWANPVVLLECEHRRAVLKINTRYSNTSTVAAEAGALAQASGALLAVGAPFQVPHVIGMDTSRALLPFEYLLTEHLPGANGGEFCRQADDATRLNISHQLGVTTRWLHAVDVPGERYGGWDRERKLFGTDDNWQHLIARRRSESLLADASATRIIASDTLAAIGRWFEGHRIHVPHRPARVLVHHDLSLWNILVESGEQRIPDGQHSPYRITGIFDFEWSIVGPAASEFATQVSGSGGVVDVTRFLDGYTRGTRLSNEFLRQVYYYQMLHHLHTVVEFSRHWCHWGIWWIEERVTRAESLLRGEPIAAFAAAGYQWPF